jgi:hypothetical protein
MDDGISSAAGRGADLIRTGVPNLDAVLGVRFRHIVTRSSSPTSCPVDAGHP